MDMLQHLRRLFAYDDWANREALAALKKTGPSPPPRSLKFLAHIVAVEWLWLTRLQQEGKPVVIWPELTLEQCETQIEDLARSWEAYFEGLTPEKLTQPVPYVNTRGESWTNTVGDILLQVVFHSSYHRGQIATEVRAGGFTPAYTDWIHAIRQGLVE